MDEVYAIFNTETSNIQILCHCLIIDLPHKIHVWKKNKERLPLLDLQVIRNLTNNMESDVFEKWTDPQKYELFSNETLMDNIKCKHPSSRRKREV